MRGSVDGLWRGSSSPTYTRNWTTGRYFGRGERRGRELAPAGTASRRFPCVSRDSRRSSSGTGETGMIGTQSGSSRSAPMPASLRATSTRDLRHVSTRVGVSTQESSPDARDSEQAQPGLCDEAVLGGELRDPIRRRTALRLHGPAQGRVTARFRVGPIPGAETITPCRSARAACLPAAGTPPLSTTSAATPIRSGGMLA